MPPLRRIPLPRSFLSSSTATRSAIPSISQPRALSSQSQSQPKPDIQLHLQRRTEAVRAFSSSSATQAASHDDHGHGSQYDEPGGWLWGIRPGEKYEYEGWEYLMWYGFTGSWIIAIIAYVNKEDTSIQTWALEEARRRLEKEGILEDPFPDHVESDSPK